MEPVLLEAWCEGCEAGFDLWGETDGRTVRVAPPDLACPNCLIPVAVSDITPKESLA